MHRNEKQFYLNTPAGDAILVEAFVEKNSVTILLGDKHRIDLDLESAFDLADALLMLVNDGETLYD